MQVEKTNLQDALLCSPQIFGDERGFFFESFNERLFTDAIGAEVSFVQDNHSKSQKNVLRGMHLQTRKPQGKLVRVISGAIFDVILDLRRSSPTYRQWFGVALSADNKLQLWVPEGFAHGFLTMDEDTEVVYKATNFYDPEYEISIAWNEPEIGIEWPTNEIPTLSTKDSKGLSANEAAALLMTNNF